LAIVTIVFAVLAYGAAHFQRPRQSWLRCHITSAVLTYYLLLGGGVNEVFLRVDMVRRLTGGFGSPTNARIHSALVGLTIIVLIWFNIRFSSWRTAGSRRAVTESPRPGRFGP
jgi:hypothetical protein